MLARKPISQLGPKAGQLQVKVLLIMKPKEFTLDKTRYSCCATEQEPLAFWKQIVFHCSGR